MYPYMDHIPIFIYPFYTYIYIPPYVSIFIPIYIYNVGKTIIRHPQVHHFYGYYKPLPVMGGL